MTNDAPSRVAVLRGIVRNLTVRETTVDAFQGDALRTRTGAAGALAAAGGLSGIAAGMVEMSMDEMKEIAFGVSFEIDGKSVRGVLWNCFFDDGDEVEVVAEPLGDHWNAFAVARPSDRIIALFPHVVSGTLAHYITSVTLWLKFALLVMVGGGALMAIIWALDGRADWTGYFIALFGGGTVAATLFGLVGVGVARKYMPFTRIAEIVFNALGWQNAKCINLRKRTMKTIRPDDPPALGPFYFRY